LEVFWERKDVNNSNDNRTAISVKIFRGRPSCKFRQADCSAGIWGNFLKAEGGKPRYLEKFMSGSKVNLFPAPNPQKLSKYGRMVRKTEILSFPNNPKGSELSPAGSYCQNLAAISLPGPVGRK
jgi:hypothetical protein